MIQLIKKLIAGAKDMNWTQIAENYWVAPQLSADDVKQAAEQGFEVIMCNRPDGEEPGQPTSAEMEKMVEAAGLSFVFLPMQGPNFTEDYVSQVKELNAGQKKVLAYCRSGNRSSILFNAAVNA